MDTVRVNICYRPLRICWVIAAGDFAAFRAAVKLSFTMWGGRFNPIVIADDVEEAESIVEVFRADLVLPVSGSEVATAFAARFRHLINPFFPEELFVGTNDKDTRAHVLDIHNALVQSSNTPAWAAVKGKGIRLYQWDDNDPLTDVFLMHLGAYPDVTETRIAYRELLLRDGEATENRLDGTVPIPGDLFEHPSIAYIARHGISRHYGIRSNWEYPGFYLGDATNLQDLVYCWNLRTTDMLVLFVDRNHVSRYQQLIPAWNRTTTEVIADRRFEHQRKIAVWTRRDAIPADVNAHIAQLKTIFGDGPFMLPPVDRFSWNGLNVQAPMMTFGEATQLGVMTAGRDGKPRISFALGDKPFCGDVWFHTQHLVASLSFIGGLYGDDLHTLIPPYVPELTSSTPARCTASTTCFASSRNASAS